jgi:hypothetical protein
MVTGGQLRELCTASGRPDSALNQAACLSYIVGVVDGVDAFSAITQTSAPYCIPDKTGAEDLKAVVSSYLIRNRDTEQYGAGGRVMLALLEAFKCKR